jgi:hypothetical protein
MPTRARVDDRPLRLSAELRVRTDPANWHSRRKQPDDGEDEDQLLDRPCLGPSKCDNEPEYNERQHDQQRKANETQHRLTIHRSRQICRSRSPAFGAEHRMGSGRPQRAIGVRFVPLPGGRWRSPSPRRPRVVGHRSVGCLRVQIAESGTVAGSIDWLWPVGSLRVFERFVVVGAAPRDSARLRAITEPEVHPGLNESFSQ